MIFVTGATGLVGSHLLVELSKTHAVIKALKRKSSNVEGVKKLFRYYFNANWQKHFDKITWVEGDVSDVNFLVECLQNVEHVYHTAAVVSFHKNDYDSMYTINVVGTENVVNACLEAGVKKLCHVSSTAAIGRTKNDGVITENNEWKTSPENSYYAVTKYASELQVWRGIEEGLNAVIINPSIILGPGDFNKSSGTIFKRAAKGLSYYTNGSNAFVDVRDVVNVSIRLCNSDISAQRFLCFSENLSYRDVFDKIQTKFGHPKARKKATPMHTSIAWRVAKVLSWFGIKPFITKENARSSQKQNVYSNEKLLSTINYTFQSVDEAIENVMGYINTKN
jgi:nucleoside-diphosphate-sugar epimerase